MTEKLGMYRFLASRSFAVTNIEIESPWLRADAFRFETKNCSFSMSSEFSVSEKTSLSGLNRKASVVPWATCRPGMKMPATLLASFTLTFSR